MLVAGFLGGLGAPELALVLVLVLILFGAGRLPQVLESFGKGLKAFRNAAKEDDPLEVGPGTRELPEDDLEEAREVERERQTAS